MRAHVKALWNTPCHLGGDGKVRPNADRDTTELNAIVGRIKEHGIGAICIQETWEEGDVFDKEANNFRIFRHNCEP